MALAILGMPLGKLKAETIREVLNGGAAICTSAGIPIGGGHLIDSPEPIYGLAVIGTCPLQHVRRNAGARPGDVLILTKPLGVGIYSSAIKSDALSPEGYDEMIATTTLLNKVGMDLARDESVHAMTDVTGFGLLGHCLEMAFGSRLRLVVRVDDAQLLSQAAILAKGGFVTGASHRNWSSYGHDVDIPANMPAWRRHLLTDPQTSGGLLIAVTREHGEAILATIRNAECAFARIIGHVEEGIPAIKIEP